ncbi:hypothetical protein BaRGS_00008895 [Batillaria attramentaria]|uniref:Uncharacterized protein n=1 Tax=Batillaria attramentaria TaxID=370345 RepID=A0ABD0LJW2_9CAEN
MPGTKNNTEIEVLVEEDNNNNDTEEADPTPAKNSLPRKKKPGRKKIHDWRTPLEKASTVQHGIRSVLCARTPSAFKTICPISCW